MLRLLLFSDSFPVLGKWIKKKFQFFLSWLIHLPAFYKTPRIISFEPLDAIIIRKGNLILTWETKNAWKVKIEGNEKFVFKNTTPADSDFDKRSFILIAYGYWRRSRSVITIQTLPAFTLQKTIVIIPEKKIIPVIDNVSIKRNTLPAAANLEKIKTIRTGLHSDKVKINIPPFINETDQHNKPKFLNPPS